MYIRSLHVYSPDLKRTRSSAIRKGKKKNGPCAPPRPPRVRCTAAARPKSPHRPRLLLEHGRAHAGPATTLRRGAALEKETFIFASGRCRTVCSSSLAARARTPTTRNLRRDTHAPEKPAASPKPAAVCPGVHPRACARARRNPQTAPPRCHARAATAFFRRKTRATGFRRGHPGASSSSSG